MIASFKNLFFFSLLGLLLFTCTKESYDIEETEISPYEPPTVYENPYINALRASGTADGLEIGCLQLSFPFGVLLADGSTLLINDTSDLDLIAESNSIIDFVFPLSATNEGGELLELAGWEAFTIAIASCVPDSGWTETQFPAYDINFDNSCYQLSYPIYVRNLDGDSLLISNASELAAASTNGNIYFVFPLGMINSEGGSFQAGNAEGLSVLLQNCFAQDIIRIDHVGEAGNQLNCFQLNFPFSIVNSTGGNTTINNGEEFLSVLYSGWFSDFVYPITLTVIETDSVVVVADASEFNQLTLAQCFPPSDILDVIILIVGIPDCYEPVYPFSVINTEEVPIAIPDFETLIGLLQSGVIDPESSIVYPINLILATTGEEVSVNDSSTLLDFYNACE